MSSLRVAWVAILLILGFTISASGQKFSKTWVGRAEAKTGIVYNSYLCELDFTRKGNIFKGNLKYYFGQEIYMVPVSGNYLPATKTIELNPFRLITFFARNSNAPDCEMDGSLTLYVDGKDSVLYGQLNPVPKYKHFCPIMEISLQAEKIVEFEEQSDTLVQELVGPLKAEALIQVKPKEFIVPVPADTIKEKSPTDSLNSRVFTTGPLILVSTDTITLALYDNGRVDNDTVSLFFNRQLVASRVRLSLKPYGLKLVLQPGINEIALFAENLGELPPNTALCIIQSGGDRFDINLSSNLSANGTVRLKRKEE